MKYQRGHGSYNFLAWAALVLGFVLTGAGLPMIWWAVRLLWK